MWKDRDRLQFLGAKLLRQLTVNSRQPRLLMEWRREGKGYAKIYHCSAGKIKKGTTS